MNAKSENRKFDQEILDALFKLGFGIDDGGGIYAECSIGIDDDGGFRLQIWHGSKVVFYRITRDQILSAARDEVETA
jgi:hypothetical protein